MGEWWSIEIMDSENGGSLARDWRRSYEEQLIESAVTNGAGRWEWHETQWGVVLELRFGDVEQWARWRTLSGTQAALDSAPDPNSVLVYRGRGGSSAAPVPRGPRRPPSAAAAELEVRPEPSRVNVTSTEQPALLAVG